MKQSVTATDKYIGRRIKTVRAGLGISQTKLGNKLGVSFQQVQKYENGSNRVSAATLHQIAYQLGEPVSSFFPGAITDRQTSARKLFLKRATEALEKILPPGPF